MEAFTDPQLWNNPGHTQAQGLMALAVLIAVASVSLISTVVSRVRLAFGWTPSRDADRHRATTTRRSAR